MKKVRRDEFHEILEIDVIWTREELIKCWMARVKVGVTDNPVGN